MLQIGRVWVLAALGPRWTTRIIVVPGAPLVRSGPYRFLSHPNYLIVAGEILVLPLAFGLPLFAVVFSVSQRPGALGAHPGRGRGAARRTAPRLGFTMTALGASQPGAAPSLRTWLAFAALCVGMFMAILDVQVVAASLPTIQTALAIQPEQMSWVQTSYLIAEVVAIPLTGLLTRALTMRWLSVATLVVFTVASMGCAWSGSLESLLAWRVVQGLAGGLLIPLVFAAGFVLFPDRGQALATTIAGMLAVLAPTVGPFVGGWITDTYDWPWLFLINVAPGVAAIATCASLLPKEKPELGLLRKLDPIALALMAVALACLEIGLKKAPQAGWISFDTAVLFAACLAAGSWFVARSIRAEHPVVELRTLGDPGFALGCLLSFILGIGLYGAVYLMPVFLAFVRNHDAMEIGQIMMVTGAAQLVMAPVAVVLERHVSARWLTAAGFGLFAVGLAASAFQTRATDFEEMLLPQVIRGLAIMLCLLPPIRIALGSSAGGGRARCERPVQSDAQSRRRDRARSDRHGHLRPRSRHRREAWPGAGARRCRGGEGCGAAARSVPRPHARYAARAYGARLCARGRGAAGDRRGCQRGLGDDRTAGAPGRSGTLCSTTRWRRASQ